MLEGCSTRSLLFEVSWILLQFSFLEPSLLCYGQGRLCTDNQLPDPGLAASPEVAGVISGYQRLLELFQVPARGASPQRSASHTPTAGGRIGATLSALKWMGVSFCFLLL